VFVVCLFFLLMVALLYSFTGEKRLEGCAEKD
jgi:hypothetical protein